MDKVLKFSVLRYRPSVISGESINLGILYDAQDGEHKDFRFIKRFARITKFDDELDLSKLKALLSGIKDDVRGTLFSGDSFSIDEYIKFFINDFYFDKPKEYVYEDWEEALETLYKSYLRFDFNKSDRPSKDDDKIVMKHIIHSRWNNARSNEIVKGPFEDDIKYDFVTDDFKLKLFDFDNKDLGKLIQTAKAWAWNCENNDQKDIIIIYRYSNMEENSSAFNTINKIFKKSGAKYFNWDDGINMLDRIKSQSSYLGN